MNKLAFVLMFLMATSFMPFSAFAQEAESVSSSLTNVSATTIQSSATTPWLQGQDLYYNLNGGAISFDGDTGGVTIYDQEGILIDSDSYIVRAAELNTDIWSNLSTNDVDFVINEYYDNLGNIKVTITKEDQIGKFITEYVLTPSQGKIKTTAYFTNYSLPNHKIAFTETLQLVKNIEINGQPLDLDQYIGVTFDRQVLEQNQDIIIQARDSVYYAGPGFDDLWAVSVHENRMLSLDYAGVDETHTAIGETTLLDPTIVLAPTNVTATQDPTTGEVTVNFDASAGVVNLNSASYDSKSFDFNSQLPHPTEFTFKTDGTKMYATGYSNDTVYQYSLGTAWDVSTASYDSKSAYIGSQVPSSLGMTISNDGSTLYVVGNVNDTIYQYSLSTPWDISTTSYANKSLGVNSYDVSPTGLHFKPDGTKMYLGGDGGSNKVWEFDLSTPWDLSTASQVGSSPNISGQITYISSVVLRDDGTKMWVSDQSSNKAYQYSLSTAWDVSTASYDNSSLLQSHSNVTRGVDISSDGSKMYILSDGSGQVYQYSIADPSSITSYDVFSKGAGTNYRSHEFVTWDSLTADGMIINGSTATPTHTSGGWDNSIKSIQTWDSSVGGTVEWETSGQTIIAGFSKDPYPANNVTNSYTYIDYGLFNMSNGVIGIYELGNWMGNFNSWSAGDTYKVDMDSNGVVKYYQNNNLVYTSTVTANGTYYLQASMYDSNSIIVTNMTPSQSFQITAGSGDVAYDVDTVGSSFNGSTAPMGTASVNITPSQAARNLASGGQDCIGQSVVYSGNADGEHHSQWCAIPYYEYDMSSLSGKTITAVTFNYGANVGGQGWQDQCVLREISTQPSTVSAPNQTVYNESWAGTTLTDLDTTCNGSNPISGASIPFNSAGVTAINNKLATQTWYAFSFQEEDSTAMGSQTGSYLSTNNYSIDVEYQDSVYPYSGVDTNLGVGSYSVIGDVTATYDDDEVTATGGTETAYNIPAPVGQTVFNQQRQHTFPLTPTPVTWTDLTNVSVNSSNDLSQSGGGQWTAGARSTETISAGSDKFTVKNSNTGQAITGLGLGTFATGLGTYEYGALYTSNTGGWRVYEGSTQVATPSGSNAQLQTWNINSSGYVEFYLDGVLKWTSTNTAPVGNYYLHVSIGDTNAVITDSSYIETPDFQITAGSGDISFDLTTGSTFNGLGDITGVYDVDNYNDNGISIDVSANSSSSRGIAMSSDGTKFYFTEGNTIYQYNLSTANDVSSATYSGTGFSIASQGSDGDGISFKSDGSKMYVTDNTNNYIYEYNLSTPWDLSTASYSNNSFDLSSQTTNPYSNYISSDGTKIYVIWDGVYEYTLSTPYDISTATYTSTAILNYPYSTSIEFNNDGTSFITLASNKLHQYSLGTAWDISTTTLVKSVDLTTNNVGDVSYNGDGTKIIYQDMTLDDVIQLDVHGTGTVNLGVGSYNVVGIATLEYDDTLITATGGTETTSQQATIPSIQTVTVDGVFSHEYNGAQDWMGTSSITTANDVSFGMWINPTLYTHSSGTYSNDSSRLLHNYDGSGQYQLMFENNSLIWGDPTGSNQSVQTAQPPLNIWTHVVVTKTGSTLEMYYNGVQQSTTPTSGSNAPPNFNALYFGGDLDNLSAPTWSGYNSNGYYTGYMDEIVVYNKVLSQSEITSLYKTASANNIATDDILIYYDNNLGVAPLVNNATGSSSLGTTGDATSVYGMTEPQPAQAGFVNMLLDTSYSELPIPGIAEEYTVVANADGSLGSSVDGTNNGTTTGVTGYTNNAWEFTNDSVDLGHTIFSGTGDFSSSAMFKTSGNSGDIWSNYSSGAGSGGNELYILSNGLLNYWHTTGGSHNGTTTLNHNQWYNVIVVNDGGAFTMYLDGNVENTSTVSGNIIGTNMLIGGINGSGTFNGTIDDVVFWDRALTSAEITALQSDPNPNNLTNTDNLLAYYDFEQTGSTLTNVANVPISSAQSDPALINTFNVPLQTTNLQSVDGLPIDLSWNTGTAGANVIQEVPHKVHTFIQPVAQQWASTTGHPQTFTTTVGNPAVMSVPHNSGGITSIVTTASNGSIKISNPSVGGAPDATMRIKDFGTNQFYGIDYPYGGNVHSNINGSQVNHGNLCSASSCEYEVEVSGSTINLKYNGTTFRTGTTTSTNFTAYWGVWANGSFSFPATYDVELTGDFITSATSSQSFQITAGSGDIDYLVVAGGGGGGARIGGGGAGGGMLEGTASNLGTGTYTVTVGNGGAGGASNNTGAGGQGTNGDDSVFDTITALGGGGGGRYVSPPNNGVDGSAGGSGGGAGGIISSGVLGGAGTSGQGYAGGTGATGASGAGGGGGAGGIGGTATSGSSAGVGGIGLQSDINGTLTYYAGGGGGSADNNNASGGLGGGGQGGAGNGTVGTAGTPNTGGGAGGQRPDGVAGLDGGSGIVIVRYIDDGSITATGGTITTTQAMASVSSPPVVSYDVIRDGTVIATVSAPTTSYTDNNVVAGTSYTYEITASAVVGTGIESLSSNAMAGVPPVAPTNLAAITGVPIVLTWTQSPDPDPLTPVTHYTIERSLNGSTWSTLNSNVGNVSTYSDNTVTPGTLYHYQVAAVNIVGTSPFSTPTSAVAGNPPSPPQNLTVVQTTINQLDLSWQVPSNNGNIPITNYKIYRDANLIATVGNVLTYNDTTPAIGTQYIYHVTAVNTAGESTNSNSIIITSWAVPDAPTNATATGGIPIVVNWTAPASSDKPVTNYKIYRDNTLLTTVGNVLTYSDSNVTPNTTYVYKISAVSIVGESVQSNPTSGQSGVPPAQITTFTVTPIDTSRIQLDWAAPNDNGYPISGYNIYRGGTSIGTTAGLTYTDTGLINNTTYSYTVAAVNVGGEGTQSASQSATTATPLNPPTNVYTEEHETSVTVSWDDVLNAVSYTVERDGNVLTTTASFIYTDTTTVAGTGYIYKVYANSSTINGLVGTSNTVTTAPSTPHQYITVTPTAPANNAYPIDKYQMYRNNVIVGYVAPGTDYVDHDLTIGTTYTYAFKAHNLLGWSQLSPLTSITTWDVPDQVTQLSGTTGSPIILNWVAPASDRPITLYNIYRDGNLLATSTTLTYSDTTVVAGNTYVYTVSATSHVGEGAQSAGLSLQAGTVPTAPTLTLAVLANNQIRMDWTVPSSNGGVAISGYNPQVSTDNGTTWTNILSNPTTALTLLNQNLTQGQNYTYKVAAINAVGTGPYSTALSAISGDIPSQVTGVNTTAISDTEIDIDWTIPANNSYAITGYNLFRSVDQTNWTTVSTTINTNSYSDTGLTADTVYYYKVSATNVLGTGAESSVVSQRTFGLPDPVTTLVLTPQSTSQINTSWTQPNLNGFPLVSYTVERSTNGTSGWTTVSSGSTNTTFNDTTGLVQNTIYHYRVTIETTFGSTIGTVVNATTYPIATNLVTATTQSNTSIQVNWNAIAGNGTVQYNLERSTDGVTWNNVTLLITGTTYTDTGLTPLTQYQYRVTSVNSGGSSSPSIASSPVTTFDAPEPPTNLTLLPLLGAEIKLDWIAPTVTNGAPVTSYNIERSTNGTTWSTLINNVNALTHTDTGLTTSQVYHYRVAANNIYGTSVFSAPANAMASDVPGQVTGLTAGTLPNYEIKLDWVAPASNGYAISGYMIERSTDNGTTWNTLVADTQNINITYTDINLTVSQVYYYKVSAINQVGIGATSTPANATAGDVPSANILTATPIAPGQIDLSWTVPNSNGFALTKYLIERSPDGTTWTSVQSIIPGGATTWSDTGLTIGTLYYYKVTTENAVGFSVDSNIESLNAGNVPGIAASLIGTTQSDTQILLNWTASIPNGYPVTGYKIEQSINNSVWTVIVADTQSTQISYTVSSLTPATDYYYRVSGINQLGTSAISNTASVHTFGPPEPVTSVTPVATSTTVTLNWVAPYDHGSAITGYKIEVKDFVTGNWLNLTTVQTTTYTQINMIPNTLYEYQITAINQYGTSVSQTIPVSTLATAPATPTVTTISGTELKVEWPVVSGTGITYTIYTSPDDITYTPGPVGHPTAYFSHQGLTNGQTVYYKITILNSSGESAQSLSASATTWTTPDAPTNLQVTHPTPLSALLTWTAPVNDGGDTANLSYTVQRSNDNLNWASYYPTTNTTYTDTSLVIDTQYYWRINSVNSVGIGGNSTSVGYLTPGLPTAPSNLTATLTGSNNNSAALNWSTPSSNGGKIITGYEIQRSLNGGSTWSTLVSDTGSIGTVYTNTGLTLGQTYTYKVAALTIVGTGSYSNNASVQPSLIAVSITGTAQGGNSVVVTPTVTLTGPPNINFVKVSLYKNNALTDSYLKTGPVASGALTALTSYPTVTSDFYVVVKFDTGFAVQSNTIPLTPAAPFSGDISFSEDRIEYETSTTCSTAGGTWNQNSCTLDFTVSDLDFTVQPVGADVIIKYQPQNLNEIPIVKAFTSTNAVINELTDLDPEKDYYGSIFVNPTFNYNINNDGTIQIICDPTDILCDDSDIDPVTTGVQSNVPPGTPAEKTFKSFKDPDATQQLGIEPMGNLFGVNMVFIFVIALAGIFTGRSAPMGVIFIVTTLGIMAYLGYLDFGSDAMNAATWGLLIISAILGIFLGKRWS